MNKLPDLEILMQKDDPDLILITESWTHSEIKNAEISLKGYEICRCDREEGRGGGCLIYYKSQISVSELIAESSKIKTKGVQSLWIEFNQRSTKFQVGLYYISPKSTEEERQLMFDEIRRLNGSSKTNTIICGDFNFPAINWETLTADKAGQQFLDCIQDCYLHQYNEEPTRNNNILDLVIANEAVMIEEITTECPLGSSDHNVIKISIVAPEIEDIWKTKYLDFRNGSYKKFRKYLSQIDWDQELKTGSVDTMWTKFKKVIERGIDQYIPSRKCPKKQKPLWYNQEIAKAIKHKKKQWDKYKETRKMDHYEKYRQALKLSIKTIKQGKRKLEEKNASNIKYDPKAFYKYAKSKMKRKECIPSIQTNSGAETRNEYETAEALNDWFGSVFTHEDTVNIPHAQVPKILPDMNSSQTQSLFISESRVERCLRSLEPEKSQGPDGMHPRVLRALSRSIAKPLCQIFTNSLKSGEVPKDWKLANVTPIHKKGPKNLVTNYRPISLTSQVCRVMERLLKEEMVNELTSRGTLNPTQHGFLPKKSCVSNLLSCLEYVTQSIDNKIPVDLIYLDFSKAFDKVPHQRLLLKMESLGIAPMILRWVKNWLSGRQQRVTIKGTPSRWLPVISGVPQGSVLGPILFLIYINDIDDGVTSKIIKFADDTKLYQKIRSPEDSIALQDSINTTVEWCNKWQMEFNPTKCKVVHIGYNNPCSAYTVGGQDIVKSTKESDLGVTIAEDLSFDLHVANSVKKANQILGLIARTYDDKSPKNILQLYKSLVRPHIEYATQIWRPYKQGQINLIEGVQRRATRMIEGLGGVPYRQRLKRCNLISLEMRRLRSDLIQVFKIISGIDDIPINDLFTITQTRTRGHQHKLYKKHCRLDARKYFFSQRIINEWNSLPEEIVNSLSVNEFKAKLQPLIEKHRDTFISQRRLPVPFLTASEK